MSKLAIEARTASVRFRVRVKPRAAKSRILGVRDGVLEVAVAAPPVDGAANSELICVLAAVLGRGKTAIEIVSGEGSRSKLISISGFTPAELVEKLMPSTDPKASQAGSPEPDSGTDTSRLRRLP